VIKENRRHGIVAVIAVATLVAVTAPSFAGAAGDAKVSAYVIKNPIAGAVALPASTLQPYLNKVLAGLAPTAPTFGVVHVAMKGWISQSNGIEDLIEIGAFPHTVVNPAAQANDEVLVSCKTATGVTPKKTTALKGIPGSTEAQCVNKKGVRLSTSIGWSYANVIVLDLVSGTIKSEAEKWALEQFKNIPATGIVVETATPLSLQYAAATTPTYNAMNTWLLKFQAWANLNGTASQAAPFDHPFVEALNACAAKLTGEQWSGAVQPKIDAAVQTIKVLSTHINNLAFATQATARSWGKTNGLDESAFLIALTTAQRATS
jgi:hypothetical protein